MPPLLMCFLSCCSQRCFTCALLLQHCEYNPIFYDTEQLELLKDGQFWLSDMPMVRWGASRAVGQQRSGAVGQ
jgi:hypothetical protein